MAAPDSVPLLLEIGTQLIKISEKSKKKITFRVNQDEGELSYDTESRKHRLVPIDSLKEIRTGPDAQYYCQQLGKSSELDRWITIVYVLNGSTYKTLHMIAPTRDILLLLESTIRRLYAIRLGLLHNTLDNARVRQTVWDRQYWKGADKGGDQTLTLQEITSMCVRLNANLSKDQIEQLFKETDIRHADALNFAEFQNFVKKLKQRPEIEALYKKMCGERPFDLAVFENFMKDTQKTTLTSAELKVLFEKYASKATPAATAIPPASSPPQPAPCSTPPVLVNTSPLHTDKSASATSAATISPAGHDPSVTIAAAVSPAVPGASALPDSTASPAVSSIISPSIAVVAATVASVPTPATSASPLVAAPPALVALAPLPALTLSLDEFSNFLLSEDNAVTRQESNDMSKPMADYFISTSHNTYLVGNQLVGVSTIEGYIRALLCACRSVELDIYDGPHEPMVYHGKTLTSRVSARSICQAIAKYAFSVSPYPVLLSCEVHCGLEQQDMLVDIMTEAFGDALVRVPVDKEHAKITVLPSPEVMKGRIMVKTKNLYAAAEVEAIRAHKKAADAAAAKAAHLEAELPSSGSSSGSESEMQIVMEGIGEGISELKSKWKKMRAFASGSSPSATDSKDGSKPKAPMSLKLASLLVFTVGVKYRGISMNDDYAPEQIFSLSESKANKFVKGGTDLEKLIRHTQTHVVRIYPKGIRVNSTNYEPLQYWAAGCQLVALNIQTMDLGYKINQAMFLRCGKEGYVLKPPALRDPVFEAIRNHTRHFFDVTIISAQQLPLPKDKSGKEIVEKSNIDPYVEVVLHIPAWSHAPFLPDNLSYTHIPPSESDSGSTSARRISFSTGTVKDNGFNPMWNEEFTLPYDLIGGMNELVFAEFIVRQDKKPDAEPLASYIAPLSSLQHGFRHLPLHDSQLCPHLFSTLFVYLNIRDALA